MSEGESQLIATARMLLSSASLLLLDEATSHLDLSAERALVRAIAAARRGRTMIVIAHHPQVLAGADRIFRMRDKALCIENGNADFSTPGILGANAVLSQKAVPTARNFWHLVSILIGMEKRTYLTSTLVWSIIHGLPLLSGFLLSRIIGSPTSGNRAGIYILLVTVVTCLLTRCAFLVKGLDLTFNVIYKTSWILRFSIFKSYLTRPDNRSVSLPAGEIISRIRDDSDGIGSYIEWTTDLIYRCVLLSLAVVILIHNDPLLALSLSPLILGVFLSKKFRAKIAEYQAETRLKQGVISSLILDLIKGTRDLHFGRGSDRVIKRAHGYFYERRIVQIRQNATPKHFRVFTRIFFH